MKTNMVILEIGGITKSMEKEHMFMQMDRNTKELGFETKKMAQVNTNIRMEM